MIDPYQPIACALHDEYEIAIMHKQQLNIKWSDDDGQHTAKVLPKDILVKDRQEFLIAESLDKAELCIRLDKIILLGNAAGG
jgi:Rho-binding antiterminator